MCRDLSEVDYVYVWVDGVHFTVRLGDDDRTVEVHGVVAVSVKHDGVVELQPLGFNTVRDTVRRSTRRPACTEDGVVR